MNIRQATEKDIPVIVRLLTALYLELGEEASFVQWVNEQLVNGILQTGKTTAYLATDAQGQVGGILTLTASQAIYAGGAYGVIDEMYVLPQLRSGTIGGQLVQAAKEEALRRGWTRLDVTTPTDDQWERTIAFYKKQGFVFTGSKLKLQCR